VATSTANQTAQTTAHNMNATSSSAAQNAALNSQSAFLNSSNLAQQRAINQSVQSSASNQQSSTQVFNNLSFLNSQNMVLSVTFTAQQAQNLLNIFNGSQNNAISNFAQFPIATPLCGAGVGVGVPGTPFLSVEVDSTGGSSAAVRAAPASALLEAVKTEE
jgi:hypothetical protein